MRKKFGVPLNTEDKGKVFVLQGLNDAERVISTHGDSPARIFDRLVVEGIDLERCDAENFMQFAPPDQSHAFIRQNRVRVCGLPIEVTEMLVQVSPEINVDKLHAPADAENGNAALNGIIHEGRLQLIPVGCP